MTNFKNYFKNILGAGVAATTIATAGAVITARDTIQSQERMHKENLELQREKMLLEQKLGYDKLQLERERANLLNQNINSQDSVPVASSSQPLASPSVEQPQHYIITDDQQNPVIDESNILNENISRNYNKLNNENQILRQDVEILRKRIQEQENILSEHTVERTNLSQQHTVIEMTDLSQQTNSLNSMISQETNNTFCNNCIINSPFESDGFFYSLFHVDNLVQSVGLSIMCFSFTTIIALVLILNNYLIMYLYPKFMHKLPKWTHKYVDYYNKYLIIENHILIIFLIIFQSCSLAFGCYLYLYGVIE